MDISLYGHLTFDRIFEDFKEYNSIGSIGNVWNFLLKINPKLKVNIQPTAIGEALVLVNKNKTERTSVGQLNIKTKKPITKIKVINQAIKNAKDSLNRRLYESKNNKDLFFPLCVKELSTITNLSTYLLSMLNLKLTCKLSSKKVMQS